MYLVINMNKIKKFETASFFFASIVGTLMHFVYELTNENPIIALIAPVNESVFEHFKLTFFPLLAFAVFEYFYIGKIHSGFFCIKAKSILLGILSVIVLYYTYTGIIGQNYMIPDVLIFYISVLISTLYFVKNYKPNENNNLIGILIFILVWIIFIVFTFKTPHINLFLDPRGFYGIKN